MRPNGPIWRSPIGAVLQAIGEHLATAIRHRWSDNCGHLDICQLTSNVSPEIGLVDRQECRYSAPIELNLTDFRNKML